LRILTRYSSQYLAAFVLAAILAVPHRAAAADVVRFDITRFVVEGNSLLTDAEIDALLAPYKGSNRGFGDVQHAQEALQAGYAKHGFSLVRVALPEQELNGGVVRLQVIEKRIGRVSVEGNRFFDTENIRRSLPELKEGATPDVGRLSANLAQANENPAKKATLDLKEGARDGDVDARVAVVDEKAWDLSLNVDNTGVPETGKTMVGVVYQNANLAGLDHVLSLQYTTTAEHPGDVHVYGVGYHAPIYSLGDSVDFYASYSDVDAGSVLAGINTLLVSGKGTVFGARFNHAFRSVGAFDSIATLGFDQKNFKDIETFQDAPLGSEVTVRPLSLAYSGTWKANESAFGWQLSIARNIPGGAHGSDEDFAAARSGATANYSLMRYGFAYTRVLPVDWQFRLAVAGQQSGDALVPGEQFGAGGPGSVRGFTPRQVSGDKGYSGSVEVYTPELCGGLGFGAYCRVLAFYDSGHVARNDVLPGEIESASISSTGLALRSTIGRNASLQLDYGHVIEGGPVEPNGHNLLNFRVSLTY
jgi:hemolysin activation/secretion protein